MEKNSLYIGRIFGIPIRVHASWFVIFALVTLALATEYFPREHGAWPAYRHWLIGAVTSALFFLSVLLHELAHSVTAVWRGMKVRGIVLFIFGGVSQIADEPHSPGTEFLMTLVGPLTSFLISFACAAVWLFTHSVSPPVAAVAQYLAVINFFLGLFNLIPGFPLDGGRLLRAGIWALTGDLHCATRWATRMGRLISYGFMMLGVLVILGNRWIGGSLINGFWFILIGWFLNNAAQAALNRSRLKRALAGRTVREVMSTHPFYLPPDMPLDELVHNIILARGLRCLPVVAGGEMLGIVTIHSVKSAPPDEWHAMRAADVMLPIERVKSIAPDKGLWEALQEMTEEGVNQLPVIEDGHLVGMLGRDAVMGFLRARADLGI